MEAIKQQLDEIKETIKKAEDRREKLFADKDRAWEKVQDQINKLEDQKFFLMQQLGESQPPERSHAWRNSNLPKKSWTSSLETIKRVPCIPI
jgi:chromosome segregation ATPase